MISPFWIIGPLIRIPIWLASEALGLAYLILCCLLAAIFGALKSVFFAIKRWKAEEAR